MDEKFDRIRLYKVIIFILGLLALILVFICLHLLEWQDKEVTQKTMFFVLGDTAYKIEGSIIKIFNISDIRNPVYLGKGEILETEDMDY